MIGVKPNSEFFAHSDLISFILGVAGRSESDRSFVRDGSRDVSLGVCLSEATACNEETMTTWSIPLSKHPSQEIIMGLLNVSSANWLLVV